MGEINFDFQPEELQLALNSAARKVGSCRAATEAIQAAVIAGLEAEDQLVTAAPIIVIERIRERDGNDIAELYEAAYAYAIQFRHEVLS